VRVFIRESGTFDEYSVVTVPWPVEPGDLVADAERVFVIEAVFPPTSRPRPVVPVLARRVELPVV
jgi:hypothetical protein